MAKIYIAVGNKTERLSVYNKVKPDIILMPEANLGTESSLNGIKNKTELWLSVLNDKNKKPIITTRTGLFLPFINLKTIVLDDPHHPGHYEQKTPRYNSLIVAEKLREIHNASLVIGVPTLSVTDYYNIKIGVYQKIRLPKSLMPEIVIQNPTPLTRLGDAKILYFLPQKGNYRGTFCQDCQTVQPYPPLPQCTNCHGTRLKPYGIGTQGFAKHLEQIYSKSIGIIDQQHTNKFLISNNQFQITVATHKIFDYDFIFDTTLISNFDHLLKLPDPLFTDQFAQTLVKLARITKNKLIISTHVPEHPVFESITNPQSFFEQELEKRKKYLLPPFSRIIKLSSQDKLKTPTIPGTIKISPIYKNPGGLFNCLITLPAAMPLGPFRDSFGLWEVEPDPLSLL